MKLPAPRKLVAASVALVLALGLSVATPAAAGILDPWWMLYRSSRDSEFVYRKGPYGSRVECGGARYSLPFGAVFLRCAQ